VAALNAHAPAHLFAPREAVRYRYAGFGGVESSRSAPGDPQFPPVGAAIDYFLTPELASGAEPLTLEVLDASDAVVRSFSSAGAGETRQAPDEPGMRAPQMVRVGTPRLPKEPGLNRFYWDLTAPGPWAADARQSGRNGPLVVPGGYTLRLTVGGWQAEVPLTIAPDPRIVKDGVTVAVMQEQFAHNVRTRDLVSDVNRLVARVDEARQRLDGASGAAADTLARLNTIRAKLVTPAIRYSRPELQDHIRYLYGMTTAADQKIGRDAVERYRQLRAVLDALERDTSALIGGGTKAG
jgi:hypothetical protein